MDICIDHNIHAHNIHVHNARPCCACVHDSADSLQIRGIGTQLSQQHVHRIFLALGFNATVPVYHGVVGSAAAYITDSKSYIVYNRFFFNRWHPIHPEIPVTYFAHEVGHIVGRQQNVSDSHVRELEADTIAGWVMRRLGATAEQTVLRFDLFPDNGSERYPDSITRRKATLEGYYSA